MPLPNLLAFLRLICRIEVKIEIYNISGKLIKTLYKGYKEAGNHEITWDATKYSAGVYFYKVRAGRLTEINKCLLMK